MSTSSEELIQQQNYHTIFIMIQVLGSISLGGFLGWYLVYCQRKACENHSKSKVFLLSIALFSAPILGYMIMLFLSISNLMPKYLCDSLTLGIVISILFYYTYFPQQKPAIKVNIEEVTNSSCSFDYY